MKDYIKIKVEGGRNDVQMSKANRLPLHQVVPLSTPFVFYIETSGYCNLKCNFCFQRKKKVLKGPL